jgi:hypothetical protein
MILDNPKSYVAKTAETPDGCLGVGAHADASEYIMPLAPSHASVCRGAHDHHTERGSGNKGRALEHR